MTLTETTLLMHGLELLVQYDAEWDGLDMHVYLHGVELVSDDCGGDLSPLLSPDAWRAISSHCLRDAQRRRAEGLRHAAEGDALDRYEDRRCCA